ncbi:hypothetical protein LshimejAT787_0304300 [Lyophyllum shimeji]|uniref:Uncharacterized protein n=1 Tax=Lyophyllum shimeji TaxID=47721 RepID=A0A9P3PHE5_LYOSH|nr:hypothetical protein LshimejAT787_0304300 [Lyophyllum shimeji]
MGDILKLLKDPFGPYPEEDILSDDVRRLPLKSFYMESGGAPIGFDETEFVTTPPSTSRIALEPTEFYGLLKIESLNWLSPQGKEWLQLDLQERDLELNPQRTASRLTLSSIYGERRNEGSRLLVQIYGVKAQSARFMTHPTPKNLIIYSRRRRMYNILSLDVGTFQKSRNFLERYRLWALIEKITKTNPTIRREQRTIDHLVESYLMQLRSPDHRQRQNFFKIPTDAEARRPRKRFLRHVSRAELRGFFAAHADWLLAQHLASSSNQVKILDVAKLISFCSKVQRARQHARQRNVAWGFPYGDAPPVGLFDLWRFGGDRAFWSKKIENARKPKLKNSQPPKMPSPMASMNSRRQAEYRYDSDFSEASTSAYSDPISEGDALAGASIPAFYLQRPVIPAGRFEWQCPGCSYTIDFLALTDENTKVLSPVDAQHLRRRTWKSLRDEDVETLFFAMVDDHYAVHRSARQLPHMPRRERTRSPHVKVEEADFVTR